MPIQNIGQDVISAYLAATRIRDQREQAAREQLLKEEQFEQAKKEFNEQMKRAEQEFTQRNAIEQGKLKLLQLQAIPDVSKGIMEGTIPSQPSPMDNTTPDFMQALQTGDFGKAYQLRSVGMKDILGLPDELVVPTPQSYAATQDILLGPAARAKAQAEAQGFNLTLPARQALAREQNLGRMSIELSREEARLKEIAAQHENRMKEIALSNTGKLAVKQAAAKAGVDTETTENYVKQVGSGSLSLTNVPLAFKGPVNNSITSMGWSYPNPTELTKFKEKYAGLAPLFKQMDDFLTEYPKEFGGAGNKITGAISRTVNMTAFANGLNQFRGNLAKLARGIGEEKGNISDKDIERAIGLEMNLALPAETNRQKVVGTYKEAFNRAANIRFGHLPLDQREAIFKTMNIDWLKAKNYSKVGTSSVKNETPTKIRLRTADGKIEEIDDTPENRRLHQELLKPRGVK